METSLSRQSIALLLTAIDKETKHYIHQKHREKNRIITIDNRTNYTLIWYGFYDLWSGNREGPILTAPAWWNDS